MKWDLVEIGVNKDHVPCLGLHMVWEWWWRGGGYDVVNYSCFDGSDKESQVHGKQVVCMCDLSATM
jgi:hypothetical protein